MPSDTHQEIINNKITLFQSKLQALSAIQIVRKYIIGGECFALSQDNYFDLRTEVAEHFDLHPNEVLVVGSAKLGFSIAPHKRYRHFGDESDIDIVLVSPVLFDRIWETAFAYWKSGSFWPRQQKFANYLFQGWIRPDKLPPSSMFPLCKDWWEFFRGLTQSRRYSYYKIRGALYKSWYFLENYQNNCVEDCQRQIIGTR